MQSLTNIHSLSYFQSHFIFNYNFRCETCSSSSTPSSQTTDDVSAGRDTDSIEIQTGRSLLEYITI